MAAGKLALNVRLEILLKTSSPENYMAPDV